MRARDRLNLTLQRKDVSSFYTKNKIFIRGLGSRRGRRGEVPIIYLTNGFKADICPFKSPVNKRHTLCRDSKNACFRLSRLVAI